MYYKSSETFQDLSHLTRIWLGLGHEWFEYQNTHVCL